MGITHLFCLPGVILMSTLKICLYEEERKKIYLVPLFFFEAMQSLKK